LKGAFNGYTDIVRALLQAGAQVDHKDINGITALMLGMINYIFIKN
jgi:ankyrin repeat protein